MKVREIAELVGGELRGNGDAEIRTVAAIESAGDGEITFYDRPGDVPHTEATCVLTSTDNQSISPASIKVANPKLAFSKVAAWLHPHPRRTGWDDSARLAARHEIEGGYIGPLVSVGEGTRIGKYCEIHAGVKIGKNVSVGNFTIIHPNCVLYDGVSVGSDVVLHAGVIIGADGFGYVRDESGEYVKFPQIGTVVIEDRVEIGANTCVDRAALGETRIGEGTKIDNLVQIGHNVQIGKRCVIAAQTGISGSTIIENDCVIGGQVGFGDHAHVKSGAIIGSQAGVLPGKIVRPGVWWGTPIQPLEDYKRQNAHLKGLERLKNDVKELKRRTGNNQPDESET